MLTHVPLTEVCDSHQSAPDWHCFPYSTCLHQQNKTYLIPLITSYSLLKPLILGVRRG